MQIWGRSSACPITSESLSFVKLMRIPSDKVGRELERLPSYYIGDGARVRWGRSSACPITSESLSFVKLMRIPSDKVGRELERLPSYYIGDGARVRWGRSSAWLERLPVTQEVASSTLVGPVFFLEKMITVMQRKITEIA